MRFFFKLLNAVYSLLNLKEKKISIYLVFFSLIGIVLESIGVILILPITSLLIGSTVPSEFNFFGNFLKDFQFLDNSLILGMGIVILVYLIKKFIFSNFTLFSGKIFPNNNKKNFQRSF